nr:hypothetical protein CFP56_19600 [Quercus suber]
MSAPHGRSETNWSGSSFWRHRLSAASVVSGPEQLAAASDSLRMRQCVQRLSTSTTCAVPHASLAVIPGLHVLVKSAPRCSGHATPRRDRTLLCTAQALESNVHGRPPPHGRSGTEKETGIFKAKVAVPWASARTGRAASRTCRRSSLPRFTKAGRWSKKPRENRGDAARISNVRHKDQVSRLRSVCWWPLGFEGDVLWGATGKDPVISVYTLSSSDQGLRQDSAANCVTKQRLLRYARGAWRESAMMMGSGAARQRVDAKAKSRAARIFSIQRSTSHAAAFQDPHMRGRWGLCLVIIAPRSSVIWLQISAGEERVRLRKPTTDSNLISGIQAQGFRGTTPCAGRSTHLPSSREELAGGGALTSDRRGEEKDTYCRELRDILSMRRQAMTHRDPLTTASSDRGRRSMKTKRLHTLESLP